MLGPCGAHMVPYWQASNGAAPFCLHMGPKWATLLGPTWARPDGTHIPANTPMWDRDGSEMGCLCGFNVGFVARPHLMLPYGTQVYLPM